MKPIVLFLATTALLLAQPRTFDVASIKPNTSGAHSTNINTAHGKFTAQNLSVRSLIDSAFGIKDFQIIGAPGWIVDSYYDIAAKTDSSVEDDKDFQPCIQAMLAERFGMKFHRETKEFQGYSLVVAKGGSKLQPHTGEGDQSTNVSGNGGRVTVNARKANAARIADILGRRFDRIVVDNTGLTGEYDFRLEWISDQAADLDGPTIYTALQEQLGLRLESTKVPVEIFVIDKIERPSEN